MGESAGLGRKLAFLRSRESYPHAPPSVEVEETHMSWVFLAGDRVYKLKKPVRYDFLDFSSLAKRRYFVAEEVRLNRRLAPDVYLGAVALTLDERGTMAFDGDGPVVDWLVQMRRLPREQMLDVRLARGEVSEANLQDLGLRLASFYRGLAPSEITPAAYVDHFITQHAVTRQVLTDPRFGFDGDRVARVLAAFERSLREVTPLLEARVRDGRIIEGHGDLRPEHVCLTEPPVVIDCLEFDRALRLVDPFDEIAFLGLECAMAGADWVLASLLGTMGAALEDRPPETLLDFYRAYRSLLRARLALLHLAEPKPRKPRKWRPLAWRYIAFAEAGLKCRPQAAL